MTAPKRKIGIVGLGLIGGSIEKCLEAKKEELDLEILTVSKSQGRPHKLEDLAYCDLIFLCSPQNKILEEMNDIARIAAQTNTEPQPGDGKPFANCIITDVASTKKKLSEKAFEIGLENFIAGHPMAGTEKQGYENSFPELFEGCNWILSERSERTKLLEEIILVMGTGAIIEMDVDTHDNAIAAVSHLPLALSIALGELLKSTAQADRITGPGFKGMARLAKGNVALSNDILTLNRKNIKEIWDYYKSIVDNLLDTPQSMLDDEISRVKDYLENVCR